MSQQDTQRWYQPCGDYKGDDETEPPCPACGWPRLQHFRAVRGLVTYRDVQPRPAVCDEPVADSDACWQKCRRCGWRNDDHPGWTDPLEGREFVARLSND